MSRKILMGMVAGLICSSAMAFDLEIALSKDTANFEAIIESESVGFNGADLSFGAFYNDESDYALTAGLLIDGTPAGDQPFTFGLGGKFYYIDVDNDEVDARTTAVALGGGVKYHIPARMPMAVGGDLYFVPNITAFGDADGMYDLRLRYEIDVLPNATAFVGYRRFEVDYEDSGDYELDDNAHLGIRFQF
jgi:hypothetical protein